MNCQLCGHHNSSNSTRCSNCGAVLTSKTVSSTKHFQKNQSISTSEYQSVRKDVSNNGYQYIRTINDNANTPRKTLSFTSATSIILGIIAIFVIVGTYAFLYGVYGTHAQALEYAKMILARDSAILEYTDIEKEGMLTKEFYESSVEPIDNATDIKIYAIDNFRTWASVSYQYQIDGEVKYGSFSMEPNGKSEMMFFLQYDLRFEDSLILEDFRMMLNEDSTIYFGDQEVDSQYVRTEGNKKIYEFNEIYRHTLEDANVIVSGFDVSVIGRDSKYLNYSLTKEDEDAIEELFEETVLDTMKLEYQKYATEEISVPGESVQVELENFELEIDSYFEYEVEEGNIVLKPDLDITTDVVATVPGSDFLEKETIEVSVNPIIYVKKVDGNIVFEYVRYGY